MHASGRTVAKNWQEAVEAVFGFIGGLTNSS